MPQSTSQTPVLKTLNTGQTLPVYFRMFQYLQGLSTDGSDNTGQCLISILATLQVNIWQSPYYPITQQDRGLSIDPCSCEMTTLFVSPIINDDSRHKRVINITTLLQSFMVGMKFGVNLLCDVRTKWLTFGDGGQKFMKPVDSCQINKYYSFWKTVPDPRSGYISNGDVSLRN